MALPSQSRSVVFGKMTTDPTRSRSVVRRQSGESREEVARDTRSVGTRPEASAGATGIPNTVSVSSGLGTAAAAAPRADAFRRRQQSPPSSVAVS